VTVSQDPSRLRDAFDFGMTDLEERLAGEDGAEIRKEIAAKLAEKAGELRKLMDAGLAPEEYEKATRAHTGLAAAYDIITRFPVNGRK